MSTPASKLLALGWWTVTAVLPGEESPSGQEKKPRAALAVIAHPDNPVTSVTIAELRAYLTMERQFWDGSRRCVLFLRPSGSVETDIVLEKVYRMSAQDLKRYWVAKLFTGEIQALPSVVRTGKAALSVVKKTEGSLSLVLATDVPDGVRVLKVDGKSPGEDGYPLVKSSP